MHTAARRQWYQRIHRPRPRPLAHRRQPAARATAICRSSKLGRSAASVVSSSTGMSSGTSVSTRSRHGSCHPVHRALSGFDRLSPRPQRPDRHGHRYQRADHRRAVHPPRSRVHGVIHISNCIAGYGFGPYHQRTRVYFDLSLMAPLSCREPRRPRARHHDRRRHGLRRLQLR